MQKKSVLVYYNLFLWKNFIFCDEKINIKDLEKTKCFCALVNKTGDANIYMHAQAHNPYVIICKVKLAAFHCIHKLLLFERIHAPKVFLVSAKNTQGEIISAV